MQWGIEQILKAGQLAIPVIGLGVLIILLLAVADRHPRNDQPPYYSKPPTKPDV